MSINLDLFCDPECREPGRDLSVPFSLNGHTYATNGHIAVRVPRRPDIPENKEAPNAEGLPWNFSRVTFGPLPEPELLLDRCLMCLGRGRKHECPDCSCECGHCNGSGKTPPRVRIGKAVFAVRYIEWMLALPGLETGKPMRKHPQLLPFRFNGGEGLLCPMTN
jgi:hypothetical protein